MKLSRNETASPWWDGFVDENGRKYGRTEEGNVVFGALASLIGQQSQYSSRYVDGLLDGYPDLSTGLHIEGSSNDYHELAVSADDAEELVDRICAYRALHVNLVYNRESGAFERLEDETRRQEFVDFLRQRGLPLPYEE